MKLLLEALTVAESEPGFGLKIELFEPPGPVVLINRGPITAAPCRTLPASGEPVRTDHDHLRQLANLHLKARD